jgi:hypothetical protein
LGEAGGHTGEFPVYFASLGARLKHSIDPFLQGEALEQQGRVNSQRWRRALESLEAEQNATGISFIQCKRGGANREGYQTSSRLTVDVDSFTRAVNIARNRSDFYTRRRYAFEQAACQVLEQKTGTFIKRLPPQELTDDEKFQKSDKAFVSSIKRYAAAAAGRGYDREQIKEYVLEKIEIVLDTYQFDTTQSVKTGAKTAERTHHFDSTPPETTAEPMPQSAPLENENDIIVLKEFSTDRVSPSPGGSVEPLEPSQPPRVSLTELQNQYKEHAAPQSAEVLAFESVGVDSFTVVMLDEASERAQAKDYTSAELREALPGLLKQNEASETSIIIRPKASNLIQVDDVTAAQLEQLRPFALLGKETSPQSYQVWLSVTSDKDETRKRLLEKLGADTSASGATRIAGSINRKPKHREEPPRVSLVFVNKGRIVTVSELEQAGLLAPKTEPKRAAEPQQTPITGARQVFPSYTKCLQSKDGDRSRADASFLKICEQRGINNQDAIAELKRVADRPKLDRDDYISRTADFVTSH